MTHKTIARVQYNQIDSTLNTSNRTATVSGRTIALNTLLNKIKTKNENGKYTVLFY